MSNNFPVPVPAEPPAPHEGNGGEALEGNNLAPEAGTLAAGNSFRPEERVQLPPRPQTRPSGWQAHAARQDGWCQERTPVDSFQNYEHKN